MPALRLDPKFELRSRCFVTKLNYDKAAKRVVSVTYTDMRNGDEYEQPAGIVILSSFVFGNVQHLLLAGIGEPYDRDSGKGVVGKNYAYQFEAGAAAFFEDKELNPYWGSAGMGVIIDDFNGENFDHGGLGFFGGGYIACNTAGAPPIAGRTVPHGTPEWGSDWKRATVKWYHHAARFNTQGSVYANRDNYMDLDPTYKDVFGRPLIRLTYNPPDNEYKMSQLPARQARRGHQGDEPDQLRHASAAEELHRRALSIDPQYRRHDDGADPKTSVVNRYLQAWDAHNLFIQGASVFPQQHGYNPTGTRRRAGLLVGAGHHHKLSQKSGTARSRVSARNSARQDGKRHAEQGKRARARALCRCRVRLELTAVLAHRGGGRPMPTTAKSYSRTAPPATATSPTRSVRSLRGVYGRKSGSLEVSTIPMPCARQFDLGRGQFA